jgi:cytochrome P450
LIRPSRCSKSTGFAGRFQCTTAWHHQWKSTPSCPIDVLASTNGQKGELNAVRMDGERLSEREFDNFFCLLIVAGNETMRHAITHGMLALSEHRDQWDRLRKDPGLMPQAVEEILRWGTVTMHFRRTATRDVELQGKQIREGDKVVVWFVSGNFDEAVFPEPDRFDLGRDLNPHMTFGSGGPHVCLGAHLARLEIRVMFEELLPRLRDLELTGPIVRLRSNFINGIKHMPVHAVTK